MAFKVDSNLGQLDLDRIQTNWDVLEAHVMAVTDPQDGVQYIKSVSSSLSSLRHRP